MPAFAKRRSIPSSISRTRRSRRFALETLESRVVLSFSTTAYAVNAANIGAVTITDSGGAQDLTVFAQGGFLAHTGDGNTGPAAGQFASPLDWDSTTPGVQELAANTGSSLTVDENGATDTLTLGTSTNPADLILAAITQNQNVGSSSALTINDTTSAVPASGASSYNYDGFTYTGPDGNVVNVPAIDTLGVTIEGGTDTNTFNITGTFSGVNGTEPVNVVGGSGSNTVNIGNNPLTPLSPLGNIESLVSVADPTGSATLNLLDAGDTTSAPATITGSTVSGLGFGSGGSVAYTGVATTTGGVTALNIDGGTNGTSGVTYNFTSTSTNTTLNDGPNADTVNITGTGVAAGTTLTINDDTNTIVNYNAGGGTPVVTAGPVSGDVVITLPGSGTVDANGIAQLNISNLPPIPIIPGPAQTINTVEGFNLVDAIVATFQSPTATILPTVPGGPPASDFTATIDWGDPSPDLSAGTITQDPTNPSGYDVTGTHTFVDEGTYSVANTVDFAGGPVSEVVNGVTVNLTLSPSGPTTGNAATATVVDAALTGSSGTKITGIEGISTGTVLLGTFVDANQAATVADYTSGGGSVVVNWGDGSGPQTLAATNLAAIGAPGSVVWTINAAHTYTEEGTYSYTVTVTDDGGASTVVAGLASIADAPLTAGAAVALVPNTGVALPSSTVVGTFTDANPFAPVSDFTAVINWGDGSPTSLGTITQPGGVGTAFDVTGGHTYAKRGVYTTTIVVKDVGGSTVTLTGTATVFDLYTVINTNPSGPGSLNQAIVNANVHKGLNTITFAIPGAGPFVIQPTAALPLPTITDPVVVNGTSEAGLVIDGNALTQDGFLLGTGSGGSTIKGLTIRNFAGAGIHVRSSNDTIQGDVLGVSGLGNQVGVLIDGGSNNTIGGTGAGAGNVISGNSGDGMDISSDGNLVQGNKIGTNAAGTAALGNTFDGISLNDASNNRIIGNVVSGNGINNGNQDAAGINLESNDSNNIIAGNEIGTNAAGDAMLGNSLHGIFLGNGSSNNTIGGPTLNDRNVISGNGKFPVADFATQGGVGVYIYGANTSGNVVQGNFIGTNAAGSAALTNSVIGVLINLSPGNTVQGNLISGNRSIGLEIAGGTARGNLVQSNKIGTNAGGTAAIPNGGDGIFINNAPNNTIGGTAAGAGNLISANLSAGIHIYGAGATNNQIFRNRIGLDANGRPTLPNGTKPLVTGIFSQISINENDFGFSTVNQNLGQVLPWQSPSSIGGGTVSGASQAAVAAHRKASLARSVSGRHGPLSKRKTVIVTAVHSYPNAKLALGLSRKSPGLG